MAQSRFTFLFGTIADESERRAKAAESSLDILESEFGGGVWNADEMSPLHEGDIIVFPSKSDIINNASGKWQSYPKLSPTAKGYKTLLQVNGVLRLVPHKSINKGYYLKSDPKTQVITKSDALRAAFAFSGSSIGANLRYMAWLQEKGLAPAWKLVKVDAIQTLKFGSDTEEETTKDLIFQPCDLAGNVVTRTSAWAEWTAVKSTYALNDGGNKSDAPADSNDDAPF